VLNGRNDIRARPDSYSSTPIAFGIFLFGGIFAAIYKAVGEKMGKDYESSYQFILGAVVISAVAVAAIELWPVLTN
jgi:hypothetical protein